MTNDSAGENGAFSPQDAMTNSVNTAYADLWHYVGGQAVVHMAAMFGVRTDISGAGPRWSTRRASPSARPRSPC